MPDESWTHELHLLEARGVKLAPGLSEAELCRVESVRRFRFPPDLRAFLARALPTGADFPDWRAPDSPTLDRQMGWPFRGIAFDIEHDSFWWPAWGSRPSELEDALATARAALETVPRLIPISGHRYLPAEPELPGNPVFSVYQTDIIHYGADLRRYVACEFGKLERAEAIRGARRVRFWTELLERD